MGPADYLIIIIIIIISRLTVVSREAKKKQHARASSDLRDHYTVSYLHGWQLSNFKML